MARRSGCRRPADGNYACTCPHTQNREDGARIVHPVYRRAGWHEAASCGTEHPASGQDATPAAGGSAGWVLNAGLVISRVGEPRTEPVPSILSIRAHRPTTTLR